MYFNANDLFSSALTRFRLSPESLHRDSPVDRFRLCSLCAMNRGEMVLIAMLGCSKLFDTIDHATLLSILELHGVDIKWFRSYQSGHFQRCRSPQRRQNLQIKVGEGEHFKRHLPGPLAGQTSFWDCKPLVSGFRGKCCSPLFFPDSDTVSQFSEIHRVKPKTRSKN